MEFTPESLYATLEKYVFRTKLTERDKEFILKQSENIDNFNPEKTLENLIENSEGRLDIYAPANKLLQNLKTLIDFPNNSQFLGIRENRMNINDSCWFYSDEKGQKFLLKSEIPLFLYEKFKPFHNDEISIRLLEAYVHKLYGRLKNTLEFIPENVVINVYENAALHSVKYWILYYAQQVNDLSYNFVDYTPEEVFTTISKFYDSENDQEFLSELRKQLKIITDKLPIRSNQEYYINVLSRCKNLDKFMDNTLQQYISIFLPYQKLENFQHFPVIRVFEHLKRKYVFVKDLEFVLINFENVKVQVETAEERKNGINLTMKYQEFKNILKQAGLTEKDFNIIPSEIQETKHDVNVPILTSYGTHCKLAGDAFREVFRVFSIDINWFNTATEKNYFKLGDWLNSLSDVFSATRKRLYFIDVWKIEEIKNRAYEEMKRYTRKSKYDPPNETRFLTKDQMYEEVKKFGANVKQDDQSWKKVWLSAQNDRNMSKWDVLVLYDHYCLFQFTLDSSKISKFVAVHLDRTEIRVDHSGRSLPDASLILQTSRMNDMKVAQQPKFYSKLDAHLIRFSNEYIYSMSTMDFDSFYGNDVCLKLALDMTIDGESWKSKIISLVYEAEVRNFENQRRSVFYLTESEFSTLCENTRRKFEETVEGNSFNPPAIDFNFERCVTEAEKRREIKKTWKSHFPINIYSDKFHDSVQEILKNESSSENVLLIALKARSIFEECSEKIRCFRRFCEENQGRTMVMRKMSEMRIDNFGNWHLFSDEVLEAVEIVLESEGRLGAMKEQIEKWRQNWVSGETFTTITVNLFNTILKVVGIEPSKFVLMPDAQFFKSYMKLPLKMSYGAVKVLSPDGREVYHQIQAQFLIFQYGACDVFWNSDDKKAKNKHRKKVMEEMKNLGKGYHLAENVEESCRRLMASDVAQKTLLSALHGKRYDEPLTEEEIRKFNKFLPRWTIVKALAYNCKALLMVSTLVNFMKNHVDEELRKNLHRAFTMSFGFFYMTNVDFFERMYECGRKKGFEFVISRIISLASGEVEVQPDQFMESEGIETIGYIMSCMMNVIATANTRNESARATYDPKELIEQHYLFDESDPLRTFAKQKKGANRYRNFGLKEKAKEEKEKEEVLTKILNLIPNAIFSLSDEVFEPFDNVLKMLVDYIQKEFDEEEAIAMCEVLNSRKNCDLMKIKLSEHLETSNIDGTEMYKRKKVEDPEKKVRVKKEESPKMVIKYVTETKYVENCMECRSIEKETMGFMRRIENLEKENEENRKLIRQNEEDLTMLKSQIGQNKLKYREEIQKHKEDVENREAKIEQLNQEIKEYREDSRIERENMYAEVRKSSRKADENVKKMKIELENSKFLEGAKNKRIEELTAENNQLKLSLEISEEYLKSSEKTLEEAENRVKILENQIKVMTTSSQDVSCEEDFSEEPKMTIGQFEQILQFDVYGILNKISKISENFGISKSELVRFQRRYDMYIRIVENENCWETADIPDFPGPFSAEFMHNFERCLKNM